MCWWQKCLYQWCVHVGGRTHDFFFSVGAICYVFLCSSAPWSLSAASHTHTFPFHTLSFGRAVNSLGAHHLAGCSIDLCCSLAMTDLAIRLCGGGPVSRSTITIVSILPLNYLPESCIVGRPDWGQAAVNGCLPSGWFCLQSHAAKATVANLLRVITAHTHCDASAQWKPGRTTTNSIKRTLVSASQPHVCSLAATSKSDVLIRGTEAVFVLWNEGSLCFKWFYSDSKDEVTLSPHKLPYVCNIVEKWPICGALCRFLIPHHGQSESAHTNASPPQLWDYYQVLVQSLKH